MNKKLTIDAGELVFAMQSSRGMDAEWYLDMENGEVLLDRDENGELIETMDSDPRYLRIEQIPSYAAFDVMENFVATLNDARVVRKLTRALSGRKPFRAFKDALCEFPEVREAWFEFEQQADLRRAARWCEENEIDVQWKE